VANQLKMALIDTIQRLHQQNWSQRRIARELQMKLLADSGKSALVLPQIRPIGDIDEDILEMGRRRVS
jgi:hypothetical protein